MKVKVEVVKRIEYYGEIIVEAKNFGNAKDIVEDMLDEMEYGWVEDDKIQWREEPFEESAVSSCSTP